MLRERFTERLKTGDEGQGRAHRLDRAADPGARSRTDIEARPKATTDGIAEPEIQQMLQGMIKQRRESIELYEQGNRPELAAKERGEIAIIERFLPKQMSRRRAWRRRSRRRSPRSAPPASRTWGEVMAALKERYAGQLDPGQGEPAVKTAALG